MFLFSGAGARCGLAGLRWLPAILESAQFLEIAVSAVVVPVLGGFVAGQDGEAGNGQETDEGVGDPGEVVVVPALGRLGLDGFGQHAGFGSTEEAQAPSGGRHLLHRGALMGIAWLKAREIFLKEKVKLRPRFILRDEGA